MSAPTLPGREPTTPPACPVCNGPSRKVATRDFNWTGQTPEPFAPFGLDIQYLQCFSCGFAFAPRFADWTALDFARHIYNAEIEQVEPLANSIARTDDIFARLSGWFPRLRKPGFLDYGCGPGLLVERLQAAGYRAAGFDPFEPGKDQRPAGQYDVVTAFEVLEHAPDAGAVLDAMIGFLKPGGVLVMGTWLTANPMQANWWYCAPRAGHVAFHTVDSLARLLKARGFSLHTDGACLHMAHKGGTNRWMKTVRLR